jgi:hypothetical protein
VTTWTARKIGAATDACAVRTFRTSARMERPALDAVPTSSSGPSAVRPHRVRRAAILRRVKSCVALLRTRALVFN